MATAHYATGGIGPLWPFIPWADFTGINLSAGQSINYVCTFPGIGLLNMNIYAPSATWFPTTAGGWPFAQTIYTGVAGNAGVLSSGSGTIIFRNIVLKNFDGTPLNKNYHVIVTDSEGTGSQGGGERLTWSTNGGPWFNLGTVPNSTSTQSKITGILTNTLVSNGSLGNGATFITPVGVTLNPTNIQLDVIAYSNQGTTFGVEVELVNLNKTVSRSYANPNDILTYTIALTNVSLFNTLANVTFVDTLPTGTTYVPSSLKVNSLSYSDSTFPSLLTLPDLGPAGIYTISFNTLISSSPPASLPNFAYASGIQGVDFNSTTSNIVSTSIVNPNLSIIKFVDKTFETANNTITYTLVIKNNGNTSATSVTLTDTLPTTTSYVSGSLTGGSGSPPTITLSNIPAGGVSTVTFKALLSSLPNATLSNLAFLKYNYVYDPINSLSTTAATISNTVVTNTLRATISALNKSVDETYADLNQTITYNINLKNTGNDTALSITFVDTIPEYTNFIQNSLYVNNVNYPGLTPNSPGITLPDLSAGQSYTITFSVISYTLPASNPINNVATLNYSFSYATVPQTINSNITSTTIATVLLNSNKLVDKSYAQVGDILLFTIPISNTGNLSVNNVTLIDTLPTGLSLSPNSIFIDGSLVTGSLSSPGLTIGSISSNNVKTISFSAVINSLPSSNPFKNQGLINYNYIINPLSTPISKSLFTPITSTTIINTNLLISKLVDTTFTTIGHTLTYSIVITNLSNITCTDLIFKDTLPSTVSFIPNSLTINNSPTAYTPNSIPLGTILVNETVTISFTVLV